MSPRTLFLMLSLLSTSPAFRAAEPALIWSDEFKQPAGSAPDAGRWAYDLGGGGWGNNELETYTNALENSAVTTDAGAGDGSALAIRALASGSGYTSARLKTQGKFSVAYGRIEARMKLSRGRGLWPAFWMLGSNLPQVGWPACGEIDIMEQLGHDPGRVYGTLHGPGYSGASGLGSSTALPGGASLNDDYHVFAVDWSPGGRIDWSLDGTIYFSRTAAQVPAGTRWVFDAPSFLILNLAVGGNWPGNPDATTTFPQTLLIDYVRVYGVAPSAPASLVGFASAPDRINLSWTAPASNYGYPVTGYRLVRATDRAFTQNLVSRDVTSATAFADLTVAAGGVYYYRLSAVTAGGISDASEILQIQPAAAAPAGGTSKLINISTRAFVGTGNSAAVAGFVIAGDAPKRILLRGIGPALAAFGVDAVLADPALALYDRRGTRIATNDDWGDNEAPGDIAAAAVSTGAFALPSGSKDAATLLTLSPGLYSVILTGANNSTGNGMIEIYEVP